MRVTPIIPDAVEFPSPRRSRPAVGLAVVCLFSVVGIIVTAFVCFLGFRSETTAALSGDITGSVSAQDLPLKAKVKNLPVQHSETSH